MTSRIGLALVLAATLPATLVAQGTQERFRLDPISSEIDNRLEPSPRPQLVETSDLIRALEARQEFRVDGSGLAAAVLDTGVNSAHLDFRGKIPSGLNFTTDYGGRQGNFEDGQGHGTNVAGVIVANDVHTGIAPGADLVPLKVLDNGGSGNFAWTRQALEWVRDHHEKYAISVVNLSLGDGGNYRSDAFAAGVYAEIQDLIGELRNERVAVCVAAGNDFYVYDSREGMGFPAICRDSISVGAVYDAREGAFFYGTAGEIAKRSGPNVITPFSQRLHSSTAGRCRMDLFAPGAPMTSTGIGSRRAESTMHGTSQATPTVAGAVLLLQQFVLRETGDLPTVDRLENWLRDGVQIFDGDNEKDNVQNTRKNYFSLDVYRSLQSAERSLGRVKTEYRELGYFAYQSAYQARIASAYVLYGDGSNDYATAADLYAERALNQAAAVGWILQYQAGEREEAFPKYAAQRYLQYADSYWAYLYSWYDYFYAQNAWSLYAAQYSYSAYAYGWYDAA